MSHYEIYVFFLCAIVFVVLTATLTGFLVVVVRQTIKLIRHGVEDEKIVIEYNKNKDRKESVFDKISMIFSTIFCLVLFFLFISSQIIHFTETNNVNNFSLKVVQSGSMSYKHEDNTYLDFYNLNDQIQTYDVIVVHELPDEFDLKLYDIVVYEYNGNLIVHRIIKIEEPNKDHPNQRYFLLQGDANDVHDKFPVTYEQMIGIYEGERVPFVGSFIMFLQSYAGILCIGLIVFALIATPLVEKKLEKEKLLRLQLLGVVSEEQEDLTVIIPSSLIRAFNKIKKKKTIKSFARKMSESNKDIKRLYNEVKNYLMRYNCKNRFLIKCESFRNKGIIAKVTISGKQLKVFLAIDPRTLETKYFVKDMTSVKKYRKVPSLLKVRSDRSVKYFKEIVDKIMTERNIKLKEKYEYQDYIKDIEEIVASELEVVQEIDEVIDPEYSIVLRLKRVEDLQEFFGVLENIENNQD